VIFFDELDALCPRRGSGSSGGGEVTERVVNQMLTEMDGLEDRKQVFVIAATNRPDMIDPAMLRPGRLDKLLYVPLPDAAGRASILKAHCRKVPLANDVDMQIIANDSRAENFSGADMSALVREASLHALRDAQAALLRIKTELRAKLTLEGCTDIDSVVNAVPMPEIRVKQSHFLAAYDQVAPSVSPAARKRYEALRRY
jgi:ribosome biogenesis ATPase